MNWFGKALGFLFGSSDTVRAIGDTINAVHTSDQEIGDLEIQEGAQVRAFAAPSNQPGLFNVLVDAFNRLPRPGITLYVFGGFIGWWDLPDIQRHGPEWFTVFTIIVTFWFGGRMLLRDAPALIDQLMKLRRRNNGPL